MRLKMFAILVLLLMASGCTLTVGCKKCPDPSISYVECSDGYWMDEYNNTLEYYEPTLESLLP